MKNKNIISRLKHVFRRLETFFKLPGRFDRAISSGIGVQLGWFIILIVTTLAILSILMPLVTPDNCTLLSKDASSHSQRLFAQLPHLSIDSERLIRVKAGTEDEVNDYIKLHRLPLTIQQDLTIAITCTDTTAADACIERHECLADFEVSDNQELRLKSYAMQTRQDKLRGMLFHFLDPGNLYMEQHQNGQVGLFSTITALLGMILFSGLLISTITNIIERRVSDVNQGLIYYKGMRDHYVVIGFGEVTMSLIEDIFLSCNECCSLGIRRFQDLSKDVTRELAHKLPTIVILTNQNVPKVRAKVYSFLPKAFRKRVFLYAGDIESREHLSRLNIHRAKEVYVLGESEEYGRDTKNLEAVRLISDLRGRCNGKPRNDGSLLPVMVQFDRLTSYSIIQKLKLPDEYSRYVEPISTQGVKNKKAPLTTHRKAIEANIFFRPFSFYENWARLLWGYTGDMKNKSYDALAYKTMEGDRYVHLVIVAFNRMGRALFFEALRLCHYPNYVEEFHDDEKGIHQHAKNKTKITIIDPKLREMLPAFKAEYPYLDQILDIEIIYNHQGHSIESPEVRQMLRTEAQNPDCLLTVALCMQDADLSMSMGLSLPDELYYNINNGVLKQSGARILIRQELYEGMCLILDRDQHKYSYTKIFGMLSEGMSRKLMNDDIAKMVNAFYTVMYHPKSEARDKDKKNRT